MDDRPRVSSATSSRQVRARWPRRTSVFVECANGAARITRSSFASTTSTMAPDRHGMRSPVECAITSPRRRKSARMYCPNQVGCGLIRAIAIVLSTTDERSADENAPDPAVGSDDRPRASRATSSRKVQGARRRVARRVSSPSPHRSGRADFPHPALQETDFATCRTDARRAATAADIAAEAGAFVSTRDRRAGIDARALSSRWPSLRARAVGSPRSST
jgi:hypothetical protein